MSEWRDNRGPEPDDERWCELEDRRASAGSLSVGDREFLLAFDASGPEYAAERALWSALRELDAPAELEARDHELLASVLRERRATPPPRPSQPPRRRGAGLLLGLTATAAAALAVLWLRPAPEQARALPVVSSGALYEHGDEESRGGSLRGLGAALSPGWFSVPEDADEPGCVTLAQRTTCAAPGTKFELERVDRIALHRGALAAEGGLSVETPRGVLSTENGAYEVTVGSTRVEVAVQRGPVTMQTSLGGEQLATGARRSYELRAEHLVAVKHDVAPADDAMSRSTKTDDDRDAPAPDAEPGADTSDADAPEEPEEPRASASEMLAAARGLRGDGKLRKATGAYRALQRAYPRSSEAHTAAVSLGQLYLELGRARRAARAFDRYLTRGGPLAEEAHWGKIQALAKLGDAPAQRDALEALERAFPRSVYLQRARAISQQEGA